MGFVPGYENDIFISYAHNDNLPVGAVRWVERLHENLENRLTQLLGKRPGIWRDRRLDSTDQVNGQLDARINTSATLLAILSPSYFESKWCAWEREKFIESAKLRAGLSVANKSRIAKVVKTFVDFDQFPTEFKETLGSSFLREDKSAGKHFELKLDSPDFEEKFEHLADSLATLLKLLKDHVVTTPVSADKTIYLAETTSDLESVRESIQRAFERDYHILPHEDLPRNLLAPELEQKVRASLQTARLSVHLLGASYGFIPEDPAERDRSIIRLQHDIAQERRADSNFRQLIWIPKGQEDSTETKSKQKAFIKELLEDSEAQKVADILRGDMEALKTRIGELMKPPEPSITPKSDGSLASVYLICDNHDRDEAQAVEDFLYDHRCEVLPPLPEGNEAQFVEYHRENLRLCDAFLVYYNHAKENWALMKKQEFLKLPGLRQPQNPVLAKAFFVTGEKTQPKDRFRSNEATVIKHFDKDFDPFAPQILQKLLQPFLDQIRQAKSLGGAK